MSKPRKRNYINNADLLKAIVRHQDNLKEDPEARPCDYIGAAFLLLAKKIGNKMNFSGYCVDAETEALTKRGWLPHYMITEDDAILSYDVKDGWFKWSPIHDIYRSQWDGNLYKIIGATIDALVTPGHKFVTKEYGLIPLENIGVKDHLITMGASAPDGSGCYSDALVELVGWFVTEGSISRYQKVDGEISEYLTIHQSRKANSEKCDRIAKCLTELHNANCFYEVQRTDELHEGMSEFRIRSGSIPARQLLEVTRNKIPTIEFILDLTQKQRLLLIETMISGDGWKTCGVKESTWQYFQKDKSHIDVFLMLCTLAGKTTNTVLRKWDTEFGYCEGYVVTISNKKTSSVEGTNFYGGRGDGRYKNSTWKPTSPYKGIVWCPLTDYGTFVVRRGKKIYVTGNTYRSEMELDAVENCVRALKNFNPEKSSNPFGFFSTCCHNSFIRRIQKEKKEQYIKLKLTQNAFIFHDMGGSDEDQLADRQLYENNEQYIQEFEASMERKKQKKIPKRMKRMKTNGLKKLL